MVRGVRNVIIMGAAGRDFHNFNVFFRNNRSYNIVAFTATQIPDIEGRKYPAKLAGRLYKKGIPIFAEEQLPELIKKYKVNDVVFSYSDVSHDYVMQKAELALSNSASFVLLGPKDTMLKSRKPVISICAVRTGSGKSPTSRYVVSHLRKHGYRVAVIRHPMPYGDLVKQEIQRFATLEHLDFHECTIEEREEYEPHIRNGAVVFAGVDYEKILKEAEKEADVILWDGGNNDFPFYESGLKIVVADPHRPGHEISYYPGETNFLMADVIIIGKMNTAKKENVRIVEDHIKQFNPKAHIVKADTEILVHDSTKLAARKVLVIEDGPTVTHGGMAYGAGTLAARQHGAIVIDPSSNAVGSIRGVYKKYPHLKSVLPAMGYGPKQMKELEETINRTKCDFVVDGTPADLSKLMNINKHIIQVEYAYKDRGELARLLDGFLKSRKKRR